MFYSNVHPSPGVVPTNAKVDDNSSDMVAKQLSGLRTLAACANPSTSAKLSDEQMTLCATMVQTIQFLQSQQTHKQTETASRLQGVIDQNLTCGPTHSWGGWGVRSAPHPVPPIVTPHISQGPKIPIPLVSPTPQVDLSPIASVPRPFPPMVVPGPSRGIWPRAMGVHTVGFPITTVDYRQGQRIHAYVERDRDGVHAPLVWKPPEATKNVQEREMLLKPWVSLTNLPVDVTEEQLEQRLGQLGKIIYIELHNTFAHVLMTSLEDARRACLHFNRQQFGVCEIGVNLRDGVFGETRPHTSVAICGLPLKSTKDTVRNLVRKYGATVGDVSLEYLSHRKTAAVCFENPESAMMCVLDVPSLRLRQCMEKVSAFFTESSAFRSWLNLELLDLNNECAFSIGPFTSRVTESDVKSLLQGVFPLDLCAFIEIVPGETINTFFSIVTIADLEAAYALVKGLPSQGAFRAKYHDYADSFGVIPSRGISFTTGIQSLQELLEIVSHAGPVVEASLGPPGGRTTLRFANKRAANLAKSILSSRLDCDSSSFTYASHNVLPSKFRCALVVYGMVSCSYASFNDFLKSTPIYILLDRERGISIRKDDEGYYAILEFRGELPAMKAAEWLNGKVYDKCALKAEIIVGNPGMVTAFGVSDVTCETFTMHFPYIRKEDIHFWTEVGYSGIDGEARGRCACLYFNYPPRNAEMSELCRAEILQGEYFAVDQSPLTRDFWLGKRTPRSDNHPGTLQDAWVTVAPYLEMVTRLL